MPALKGGRRANGSRAGRSLVFLAILSGLARAAASREPWLGQRASATIETALAVGFLVIGLAGLVEIVNASYATDRMARAAHAAARAVSLDKNADPCSAIRRELHLDEDFDCDAEWVITVDRGLRPTTLPATLDASAPEGTGDMVLVRIAWTRDLYSFERTTVEDETEEDEPPEDPGLMALVAFGLARCEPGI